MNKTLRLAFLVSITLNVLLVGVLLGQLPRQLDRPLSARQRIEIATNELPETERSRVGAKLAQMRNETNPIREQIQRIRNETIAIFVAEPFDEAAYDRHVSKIDELRRQMSRRMAANMKEIAKELPAEQRKTLARAFERPPRPR
jgi:uncharacterized membrane protein